MKIIKILGTGPHHRLAMVEDKRFAVIPCHLGKGDQINLKQYKKKVGLLGETLIGVDLQEKVCDPKYLAELEEEARRVKILKGGT